MMLQVEWQQAILDIQKKKVDQQKIIKTMMIMRVNFLQPVRLEAIKGGLVMRS